MLVQFPQTARHEIAADHAQANHLFMQADDPGDGSPGGTHRRGDVKFFAVLLKDKRKAGQASRRDAAPSL